MSEKETRLINVPLTTSDKTCWLVDEKNGIATDGKRYWCAKKSWKCCEGMIPLDHAVEVLAKTMCESDIKVFGHDGYIEYKDWGYVTPEEKQRYINRAKELLK